MTGAPSHLYAGFLDADSPVLCFAGEGVREAFASPRKLFATLRAARAPAALRSHVLVVSRSAASAAVFVTAESEVDIARFTALAHLVAVDLREEDAALPELRWTSSAPFLPWGALAARPAPGTYLELRFDASWALNPEPAHRVARALWAIDRRERGLSVLRTACETSVEPLDHFHLGEIQAFELQRPADAVDHLRRACELAPSVGQSFTSLGLALQLAGKPEESIVAFQRACELDATDFRAWANLAQAHASVGDEENRARAAARAEALDGQS